MVKEEDAFVIVLLGFLMMLVLGFGWMMFMPMFGFVGHVWFGFWSWPALVTLFFVGLAAVGFFLLVEPRRRDGSDEDAKGDG